MAVGKATIGELHAIAGFRLGTASAGIKKPGRRDLVVMEIAEGSSVAGVYTTNAFCAAPVRLARQHAQTRAPRYFLVNTGNANAGTGEPGLAAALECCRALARHTGLSPEEILPFSTGVIGQPLPVDRITAALPAALAALDEKGWLEAAHGIMTTDTRPKAASRAVERGGRRIALTGIAKGAGMIKPNMATMLAYIATDAAIEAPLLQELLNRAVNKSFNRITVDGDTSTNDCCMLAATGHGGVRITRESAEYEPFREALEALCIELAQGLVRDAEGATKFIGVRVEQAQDAAEALKVGYAVAESPLVKTALFASDPNWGRILAAVGRAGIEGLEVEGIDIFLGDVCIVKGGGLAPDYTEEQGARVMAAEDIDIVIRLARGSHTEQLWTCDFSYDYVKINAEYRT